MENYSKGKNVEEPLERNKIPIPNLPDDFIWMQVRTIFFNHSRSNYLLMTLGKGWQQNQKPLIVRLERIP